MYICTMRAVNSDSRLDTTVCRERKHCEQRFASLLDRVVTKISSCRVNTTSRRGITQGATFIVAAS